MEISLPFWTAKTIAKIFLLCVTRSSCKPCSQSALHCVLYYSSHSSRSGTCADFSHSGSWTAPGVQTFLVQSLGADPACRTGKSLVLPWTMLTWKNCTSTAAPVANAPPDKRWVTDMNDLDSRSCQLSKHWFCAGWDICSIGFLHIAH